jgi:hypothetical protein
MRPRRLFCLVLAFICFSTKGSHSQNAEIWRAGDPTFVAYPITHSVTPGLGSWNYGSKICGTIGFSYSVILKGINTEHA